MDHSKHPRNFGKLGEANRAATGYNALCGDRLTLYLAVENDLVKAIQFQGVGCGISIASASLLTERLKGKTIAEAEVVEESFREWAQRPGIHAPRRRIRVFSGVRVRL